MRHNAITMMIDPRDVDWTEVDDGEVWLSAKSGIPEAVAEAHRRGLLNPEDVDGSAGTTDWPRIPTN